MFIARFINLVNGAMASLLAWASMVKFLRDDSLALSGMFAFVAGAYAVMVIDYYIKGNER